jgi:hypothetical protein
VIASRTRLRANGLRRRCWPARRRYHDIPKFIGSQVAMQTTIQVTASTALPTQRQVVPVRSNRATAFWGEPSLLLPGELENER